MQRRILVLVGLALLASSFALGQDFQCDGQGFRDYRDLRDNRFDCCPNEDDSFVDGQYLDSESTDVVDWRQDPCDFRIDEDEQDLSSSRGDFRYDGFDQSQDQRDFVGGGQDFSLDFRYDAFDPRPDQGYFRDDGRGVHPDWRDFRYDRFDRGQDRRDFRSDRRDFRNNFRRGDHREARRHSWDMRSDRRDLRRDHRDFGHDRHASRSHFRDYRRDRHAGRDHFRHDRKDKHPDRHGSKRDRRRG